ncbi:CinA family protein [Nocardioides sp.]|uniref:CinA family protein n=1 Tax=Nocardioides sp. TaxID=35761 RepID=UPI0027360548|nr:CinA family protein [Nocardioides sp.]MDP3892312.1 CinA family protein [Nocardioides sp.]
MSRRDDQVARIAASAKDGPLSVACAESLTAGGVASALARGDNASSWLRGAVVAYASEVKFEVLDVPDGPVVTAACATQMAVSVAEQLRADASVATTGVGGPDPQEGEPAGTVYIATSVHGRTHAVRHEFDGDPASIIEQTIEAALTQLATALTEQVPRTG